MIPELKAKIITLHEDGRGYKHIAKHLGINVNTCKTFCRKYDLLKGLPPKVKAYRGKIKGRNHLQITRYIAEHPTCTRSEIIEALDLSVVPQTLSNYFKHQGIAREKPRVGHIISAQNRLKRVEFAKLMLENQTNI